MAVGLLVFACFAGAGYYIWCGYRSRKVFFANISDFCAHLSVEISFSKNTVRSVIETYASGYARHFREVLFAYRALLDGKQDITKQRIATILRRGFLSVRLKPSEESAVTDFFFGLGRHGAAEEQQKILNSKNTFDKLLDQSTQVLRGSASIYFKLFIIMGAGAVILLL